MPTPRLSVPQADWKKYRVGDRIERMVVNKVKVVPWRHRPTVLRLRAYKDWSFVVKGVDQSFGSVAVYVGTGS